MFIVKGFNKKPGGVYLHIYLTALSIPWMCLLAHPMLISELILPVFHAI